MTGASAPAQKYVTFDDDIPSTRTYDNSQPFTGTSILVGTELGVSEHEFL